MGSGWKTGALRGVAAGVLVGTALACAAPAAAEDDWGFQFGPVGDGPGSYGSSNRSFARQWQANPPKGFPTISSANIGPTKAAIERYEQIVKDGGFPTVPEVKLEPGQSDEAVAILSRRLAASGELQGDSGSSNYFNSGLEDAVKRFQEANGLAPTGIVDRRTTAALNVPANVRLKQLKLNLRRLSGLVKLGKKRRYVLVNIPAAQVEAVENGEVASRHSGVVGKPDRATPVLRSTIRELNFNPTWKLPPTVIKEDLIPKGRQMQQAGKDVLVTYGIDAYSGGRKIDPSSVDWSSSQPFRLAYRQAPGKDNPLGFVKINFANHHSVYMHDSPKDSLFGRSLRAASSGCVRVQNIEELAAWLLKDKKGWNIDQVKQIKESGRRGTARLKRGVPLYFAYVTAWATEDGTVQFRPDLYQKDGVGEVAAAY
jgi:L,D-transpeptidase YcbB